MNPQRIQRKRTKGWRMPEGAVYVGRPTRWGNPWKVAPYLNSWSVDHATEDAILGTFDSVKSARYWAVQGYRRDLPASRDEIRAELAGRDLACWCPLDQPCHADVLLEIANPPATSSRPSSPTAAGNGGGR